MNFEEAVKFLENAIKKGIKNYIKINGVHLRIDNYIISESIKCIDLYFEEKLVTCLFMENANYTLETF